MKRIYKSDDGMIERGKMTDKQQLAFDRFCNEMFCAIRSMDISDDDFVLIDVVINETHAQCRIFVDEDAEKRFNSREFNADGCRN